MSFRPTHLKDAFYLKGPDYHRELLCRAIWRHCGNLHAIGWDLGVSHRTVRRHVVYAGLWGEVFAARKRRPQSGSDLLARALEAL